jgi:carboxypeptidase family protein
VLKKICIVDRRAWLFFLLLLCLCGSRSSTAQEQLALLPHAPKPEPGIIVGTVIDGNDDAIPGATVVLQSPTVKSPRTLASNDKGFFEFNGVEPETYHVRISAQGFADWTSPDLALKPGQYVILTVPRLQIATAFTSVTVGYSAEQIATEQVKLEEKERIFGIIPNFYVSYDQNAAPLTAKLKFRLAAKVAFDPITFIGVGIAAGAEQAGNHPNYPQGAKGYAERYGAVYANGFTDIMIGGAILPSLLHQDPTLLLPRHGDDEVSRAARSLVPIHLQGRQWAAAAELLDHRWRSRLGCHRECLLSSVESRSRTVFRELPNRNRPTSRCQPGTRIHPESGHAQS